ncbi:MAG: membrane protein insertion efficiency factor YidD [Cellulomonadaceae bacterium]
MSARAGTGGWDRLTTLPARILVTLLRVYQLVVSPMTGPTCRYYPTCSEYAVRAVRQHGLIRGSGLAVWRLLRCNPWSLGGVDDVPGTGPVASGTDAPHHEPRVAAAAPSELSSREHA